MQKKYRLTHKKAFNYVYRRGKSTACDSLILMYAPTKYGKRFGFSISKKVGKAVVRNKIKRQLKNAIIPLTAKIDNGYNYIFVVRPVAATLSYDELVSAACKLMIRAKVLTSEGSE